MNAIKIEKILILVKTYPNKSNKYVETVCTAGIREDGSWVRIFPVQFRLYANDQKYAKYQWIECRCYKASSDLRPESHHIDIDLDKSIILDKKIGTEDNWEFRRRAILDKAKVFTRFAELHELVDSNLGSLAVFKPASVKLKCEKIKVDNASKEVTDCSSNMIQFDLFHDKDWQKALKRVEPIPYDFKYEIVDADGKMATHKILDWELGTLFFKEKKRLKSEELARESVKQKYGIEFLNDRKVDLYLYMGTMLQFQKRHMPNPWTIIGVAPFPKVGTRPQDLFQI